MPAAPSLLDADRLGVALDGRPIVQEVSFTVGARERIALVGPNGAGKTTLLRAVCGLLPHTGSLRLAGRPVRDWTARERARTVALVRQQTSLAVDFTVAEVVALGRSPHLGWMNALSSGDEARVQSALDAVDLGALTDRAVPSLSGGERQRVFLAQALAQDAPLLLLDEPTAHLDVRHQLDLLQRVRRLADEGRTVIAAVHDLALAAHFADRVWILDGGRLVADGPPADVLTPERLHATFGVRAAIEPDEHGLRIRYLAALPPTA